MATKITVTNSDQRAERVDSEDPNEPVVGLLNVSAYKPGDFRQFFEDPRTRADYLQWAPLLLTAEEFHAGNIKLGGSDE